MIVRRHAMRFLVVLLLRSILFSPCVAAVVGAAQQDPTSIMTAIYQDAVKTEGSGWLDPDERPKRLSKALVALWAKVDAKKPPDGDVGPIDFDLTADTNGLELASFVVRVQNQDTRSAIVAVELGYKEPYSRQGRAIVTYDFIREEGRWAIDNIRTDAWSVRRLLTDWLKDP